MRVLTVEHIDGRDNIVKLLHRWIEAAEAGEVEAICVVASVTDGGFGLSYCVGQRGSASDLICHLERARVDMLDARYGRQQDG